jgi:GTPase SAR1 family protein
MDILKENADLARVALTLVGNKIDLAGEREVEADQGRRLASQFSIPFCEVSARSAEGVDFLFKEMARRVGHVLTSPARALKLAPEQDKGCCF